jgi:hypothetical protein
MQTTNLPLQLNNTVTGNVSGASPAQRGAANAADAGQFSAMLS